MPRGDDDRMPRRGSARNVVLRATHEEALRHCSLKDLTRFAVDA